MLFPLVLLAIISTAVIVLFITTVISSKRLRKRRIVEKTRDHRLSVGIFHPYCNSGCPEERVLWLAIISLQARYPQHRYLVYTGDKDLAPEQILANASQRLNITVQAPVEFVYLLKRKWVEPASYPRLTRLGINFGSLYVGFEAIFKFVPDVYIDTMGYPFTLPIFKYMGGCRVACYINSVSPDILYSNRVSSFERGSSTRNRYIKYLQKFTYSKLYGKFYSWAGRCSDIVMVNSSWTEDRINYLWECPSRTYRVYPPCPVQFLEASPVGERAGFKLVALGPFVPHTDHPLQIRTLFQLRQLLSERDWDRIRLVLIGPCHTPQESTRVKDMEDLCKHLSVEDNVTFKLNLSYNEVRDELHDALIGVHSMYADPFGIGVVEYMAAGVITVANNSLGGTMRDITMDYNGCRNAFLATDELEYAEAIKHIIFMRPESRAVVREQAQASVNRFSESQFEKAFLEAVDSLFKGF